MPRPGIGTQGAADVLSCRRDGGPTPCGRAYAAGCHADADGGMPVDL